MQLEDLAATGEAKGRLTDALSPDECGLMEGRIAPEGTGESDDDGWSSCMCSAAMSAPRLISAAWWWSEDSRGIAGSV